MFTSPLWPLILFVGHVSICVGLETLLLQHINVANGYFSPDIVNTGVENENNKNANTYSIIGSVDQSKYIGDDGYYEFKLHYDNKDGAIPAS